LESVPVSWSKGKQFLIQSPSPDWIKRKIFLSDLWGSAVNLILKKWEYHPQWRKEAAVPSNSTVRGQQ
jgi:hypothetical protein